MTLSRGGGMKLVLGLTGGSGSGKSAAAQIFKRHGAEIIDADIVAAQIISEDTRLKEEIAREFGRQALNGEGEVNRPVLAKMVFGDGARLEKLSALTHPPILKEIERRIKNSPASYIVVDAAALFESGGERLCDYTAAVIAPLKTRVGRIISRDNLDERSAKARIGAQKEDDYYIRRADFVIENDAGMDKLESEVGKVIDKTKNRPK